MNARTKTIITYYLMTGKKRRGTDERVSKGKRRNEQSNVVKDEGSLQW
jgi:hypothetical protein